ncbi:hypothetical protein HDU98_007547 [Podochytrium sp. JEL0797]|nr:hypothetical protein HDU98_007547 [Podochytrium sp. JEL0797]
MTAQPETDSKVAHDDPAFMNRWVKASAWDESIPMSLANPDSHVVQGPPFLYLMTAKSITLLEFTGANPESIDEELAAVLRDNADKTICIEVETLFSESLHGIKPSTRLMLQSSGFECNRCQRVRVKHLDAHRNSERKLRGVEIERVTPELAYWDARIDLEAEVFGYPANGYVDRLKIALKCMIEKGDQHWIARVNEGGKEHVVGYMTMRYRHGLAYLQGAGVLESFRKMGITRLLLDSCVAGAKSKGFKQIVTTGWTTEAEMAWVAMGFVEVVGAPLRWERKCSPRK